MNQLLVSPKPNLNQVLGFIGDQMQFHLFSGFNPWDLEGLTANRDFAIAIRYPFVADAEDIFAVRVALR